MGAILHFQLNLDTFCDFTTTQTWKNASGSPNDFTGYTASLVIRALPGDLVPIVTISTTPSAYGSILLGGALGTARITLTAAATALFFGIGEATYDLLITSAGGIVTKFLEGPVQIEQTVGGHALGPLGPPAVLQANYYWDPVSGSDANSGVVGFPVKTYAALARILGGTSPVIRSDVTVNVLSSPPDDTDPVICTPVLLNGASLLFNGVLGPGQQIDTGTITSQVPINRGAGTLATITLPRSLAAVDDLIHDTTVDSWFWVKSVAGSVYTITPSMQGFGDSGWFANFTPPPLRYTIAAGDTYVVYRLSKLNACRLGATMAGYNNPQQNNGLRIQRLTIGDNFGVAGVQQCEIGDWIAFGECRFDKVLTGKYNPGAFTPQVWGNCNFKGPESFVGAGIMFGGIAAGQSLGAGTANGHTFFIDGDAILVGLGVFVSAFLGQVYVEGPGPFLIGGGNFLAPNFYALGVLWGPGGLQLYESGSVLTYNGQLAAAAILMKGAIVINGLTTASSWDGVNNGVAITPANLDKTVAAGGFGGTALNRKVGGRITDQPL